MGYIKKITCPALLSCWTSIVLSQPGTLDLSFDPSYGANDDVLVTRLDNSGRILIGGWFTNYQLTGSDGLARLDPDGSLDPTFDAGSGLGGTVTASLRCAVVQPDEKIVLGGLFTEYNGTAREYIARVMEDGSLDTSFDPGSGADDQIRGVALQPDGRIVVGGWFNTYAGAPRSGVARLEPDGSLDATFDPGTGTNDLVYSIALQPDGKILIGGDFTLYDGAYRYRIARLNANGSLDASFDPGLGANGIVHAIAVQPDGDILICGEFYSYDGTPMDRIARLHSDGSMDTGFGGGSQADNGNIYSCSLQPDGKIIIGGSFTGYNGVQRLRLARVNADGSLDTTFTAGTGGSAGPSDAVYTTELQPDGKVIIGGTFSWYSTIPRNHIARVNGGVMTIVDDLVDPGLTIATDPGGDVIRIGTTATITDLRLEDTSGRVIMEKRGTFASNEHVLHIGSIGAGTYLLILRTGAGRRCVARVVKGTM